MNKPISWSIDSFDKLNVQKLYSILHLRSEVFVVEQEAIYLDTDNKDQKAIHLQGYINNDLVAYCRLFKSGDYFDTASIGRVVVPLKYRKLNYGHQLLDKAIDLQINLLEENLIKISAQFHLKKFYESHGFQQISDIYQEDGIPHIRMLLNKQNNNI